MTCISIKRGENIILVLHTNRRPNTFENCIYVERCLYHFALLILGGKNDSIPIGGTENVWFVFDSKKFFENVIQLKELYW